MTVLLEYIDHKLQSMNIAIIVNYIFPTYHAGIMHNAIYDLFYAGIIGGSLVTVLWQAGYRQVRIDIAT